MGSSRSVLFAIIVIVKKKTRRPTKTKFNDFVLNILLISEKYLPRVSPMLYTNRKMMTDHETFKSSKVLLIVGPG